MDVVFTFGLNKYLCSKDVLALGCVTKYMQTKTSHLKLQLNISNHVFQNINKHLAARVISLSLNGVTNFDKLCLFKNLVSLYIDSHYVRHVHIPKSTTAFKNVVVDSFFTHTISSYIPLNKHRLYAVRDDIYFYTKN